GVLGGVFAALLILLPVFLLSASIADLEAENAQIVSAMREIQRARGRLASQRAERDAAEARYAQRAPSLGAYLEARAAEQEGLSISDVQHEPERELGRFRVRHTRARFQGTGLRAAILLLADVENSRYPVAIERIHVDHHQTGDRYNMQVGVLAFDRQGAGSADGGVPAAPPTAGGRRAAGPPAPP
ncbi:MAG: hypothetical protein IT378_27470, partial [Sandaracinaceae bacterium]|nr:hypothetical protein [Sandaracinaceae bacterium]